MWRLRGKRGREKKDVQKAGKGKERERERAGAAGYQRRTAKVIKLGWTADSDRLVGHSIGNSTNLWTS